MVFGRLLVKFGSLDHLDIVLVEADIFIDVESKVLEDVPEFLSAERELFTLVHAHPVYDLLLADAKAVLFVKQSEEVLVVHLLASDC